MDENTMKELLADTESELLNKFLKEGKEKFPMPKDTYGQAAASVIYGPYRAYRESIDMPSDGASDRHSRKFVQRGNRVRDINKYVEDRFLQHARDENSELEELSYDDIKKLMEYKVTKESNDFVVNLPDGSKKPIKDVFAEPLSNKKYYIYKDDDNLLNKIEYFGEYIGYEVGNETKSPYLKKRKNSDDYQPMLGMNKPKSTTQYNNYLVFKNNRGEHFIEYRPIERDMERKILRFFVEKKPETSSEGDKTPETTAAGRKGKRMRRTMKKRITRRKGKKSAKKSRRKTQKRRK